MGHRRLSELKIMQAPVTVAEYSAAVAQSRELRSQGPDMSGLTAGLIEAGLTAWDIPEFERWLKIVISEWAASGHFIRVEAFTRWLLTTTSNPDCQQWLTAFNRGDFFDILYPWELSRSITGGSTYEHLNPLRVDRLIAAQVRQDEAMARFKRRGRVPRANTNGEGVA